MLYDILKWHIAVVVASQNFYPMKHQIYHISNRLNS